MWRFGECDFDDLRYELRVGDRVAELERKPLDLLRYLLSKSGEVVTKEELLEAVWPGVMVVDASLATAVSKLHKALGDQPAVTFVSVAASMCYFAATNVPSEQRAMRG